MMEAMCDASLAASLIESQPLRQPACPTVRHARAGEDRSLQCEDHADAPSPLARVRTQALVPRHQGDRPCGLRPVVPGRLQHHRLAAVRRPGRRRARRAASSCACTSRRRRSSPTRPRSIACSSNVREQFGMEAQLHALTRRPRVMLMVSKHGHCLNDLLFRWRSGQLHDRHPGDRLEPQGLLPSSRASYDIPFHHLPLAPGATPQAKRAQEARVMEIVEQHERRPRRARALHADPVAASCARSSPAARSTSTTASCRASRARSRTTRRTTAA